MKILIIDDEMVACRSLQRVLSLAKISDVVMCTDALKGEEELFKGIYDIALIDIMMPQKNGDRVIEEVKKRGISTEFIVLSAVDDIPIVVKCIKLGAYDYLVKPLQKDLVVSVIKKVYEHHIMKGSIELFTTSQKIDIPEVFRDFVTDDINMKKIMAYAAKLASLDCNILISGETGTGKEMFAKAIHEESRRKNNHFVAVNVNAVPPNLFESSLFGYIKGAFSGAVKDQEGYLHKANGGTLFLDEIGDLDINSQTKLLRVIQERNFYPVGSNHLESSDFRLIAATNKNLFQEVQGGRFRRDLYFRLKAGHIFLAPLRERSGDIIYIARILLRELRKKNEIDKRFSRDALYALQSYPLTGNFRELQYIVENAFYKSTNAEITRDCFEFEDDGQGIGEEILSNQTIDEMKRRHISKILAIYENRKKSAEVLGISVRQLYEYIKKYALTKP